MERMETIAVPGPHSSHMQILAVTTKKQVREFLETFLDTGFGDCQTYVLWNGLKNMSRLLRT